MENKTQLHTSDLVKIYLNLDGLYMTDLVPGRVRLGWSFDSTVSQFSYYVHMGRDELKPNQPEFSSTRNLYPGRDFN